MKLKLVALLLIFFPLIFSVFLILNGLELFWYVSEGHQFYDLAFALLLLLKVVLGIRLLTGKTKHAVPNTIIVIVFLVYQAIAWKVDSSRYIAHIDVPNTESSILIVPYDGGAFSSSSFVNLEIAQPKYAFFLHLEKIQSFENVKNATLELQDNSILKLELTFYSDEVKLLQFKVSNFNGVTTLSRS